MTRPQANLNIRRRSRPGVAVDRRQAARFPSEAEVRWRSLEAGAGREILLGRAVNVSSSGILFTGSKLPRLGELIEIAVDWPVALNAKCQLQLMAHGSVVRITDNGAAMRIERYEFRTRRVRTEGATTVEALR